MWKYIKTPLMPNTIPPIWYQFCAYGRQCNFARS